jgi:hypothetical protein
MRRAAALVATMLPVLAVACGTKARENDDAQAAANLRAAHPAIAAYYQDHNTYAGMTPAKLRASYDSGVAKISIVKASKKAFCVEATGGSHVFMTGPSGELMLGSCDDPNGGKPYNPPQSIESTESSEPLTPTQSLRASIPAIEAYYQDHNAYSGMTPAKLREEYDSGLPNIEIVQAVQKAYCIEIDVDGERAFTAGPVGEIRPGTCPS